MASKIWPARSIPFAFVIGLAIPCLTIAILASSVDCCADDDPFAGPVDTASENDKFAPPPFGLSSPSERVSEPDSLTTLEAAQKERHRVQREQLKQVVEDVLKQPTSVSTDTLAKLAETYLLQIQKMEAELAERTELHKSQHRQQMDKLAKVLEDLDRAREESQEIEERDWEQQQALRMVARWMNERLQPDQDPALQASVLHLFDNEIDLLRKLNLATGRTGDAGDSPLYAQLIRIARDSRNQAHAEQAIRILRRADPSVAREAGFDNRPTDPWPIVVQRNHTMTRDLLRKLNRIESFELFDIPLEEVINFLEIDYDLNIVLDQQSIEEAAINLETLINFENDDLTIRALFEKMLTPNDLGFYVEDDCITITTQQIADAHLLSRVYDIQSLIESDGAGSVDDTLTAIGKAMSLHDSSNEDSVSLSLTGSRLIVVGNERYHHRIAVLLRALDHSQSE